MSVPARLNLEPLERAFARLNAGLAEAATTPDSNLARDRVIERFEVTIDLSWKLLERHLKPLVNGDSVAIRTKQGLFREAARRGLVANADAWITHYETRNETSRGYDAQTADRVFDEADRCVEDVRALIQALGRATQPAC